MNDTTLDIPKDSAVLILNNDMSTRIALPAMKDGDTVDFDKNKNVFVAIAIAALLEDDEFKKLIETKLDTMIGGLDGDCGSESNCGGCCGCDVQKKPEDNN